MMKNVPTCFVWASGLLNISPTDNILEIGCGTGILAGQIAGKLKSRRILSIDRSIPHIEKAKKRNNPFISDSILTFQAADLLNAALPDSYFDSVLAFNVGFFSKNPESELRLIRKVLKGTGKLFIFYQAPFEIVVTAAAPVKRGL